MEEQGKWSYAGRPRTYIDRRRLISVGLSNHLLSWYDMPGWQYRSFAYHGDDGHVGVGNHGLPYADKYTKNDTIGCGVNCEEGTAYFTKNGKYLGTRLIVVTGM